MGLCCLPLSQQCYQMGCFLLCCYNLLWHPSQFTHSTQNLYVCGQFSQSFYNPLLLSGSTIFVFSNWVTSAQQQRNLSFYLVLFSPPFSFSKTRAPEAIWLHLPLTHPHLGPCSYYACLSLCRLFFSEYCSNTELAINHIALSPRGMLRLALCPPTAHLRLAGGAPCSASPSGTSVQS